MNRMMCADGVPCNAHRDGDASTWDKCPGTCDAPGCREDYAGESARSEDSYCAGHLALDHAGASPDEMAAAGNKASMYGVTLSRLLREAVKMVPQHPEVDRT